MLKSLEGTRFIDLVPFLLGQGPIFQSLSFYILDKVDTLKNE